MKSCRFALLLLAVFGSALSQTPLVQMQTYLMASATGPVIAWQVCVPIEPVDVQAIATAKAAAQFSEAYLKSAVHQCASYAEWRRHVTDDYAKTLQITEANFSEKKAAPRRMQKTGAIVHWVTASDGATEMLYLVERVKYRPEMPESLSIRLLIREKGQWLVHARDELNLIGKMAISDLQELKRQLAGKGA
jgi:hypothetical protein